MTDHSFDQFNSGSGSEYLAVDDLRMFEDCAVLAFDSPWSDGWIAAVHRKKIENAVSLIR